ncbi:hypothetical protein [uncultured Chryseobacterium sp.]|uniref:hypothetical protein n=1 Tax=uncultured Chryseobacterium sp. TaxID=259322 RepID=UPI00374808EC
MTIKFFIFLFLTLSIRIFSQEPEKVTFKDTQNFYYKIMPEGKPAGLIMVLPGGGETPEKVMNQIYLDELAVAKNLLVVFPGFEDGDFKMETERKFLDRIAKDMVEKYKISKDQIVIGGLSYGGMLAVKYAEMSVRDKQSYFTPKAIFALDPPLDYEKMYYQLNRDIDRNYSEVAVNEAKNLIKEMVAAIGYPDRNRENYLRESMFLYSDKEGGNAIYLMTIPVLIYMEPGIMWQMNNRGRDLYDTNAVSITAMMNLLKLKGHKNAELIIVNDRGVRPEGFRHPHSWSIMDPEECLNWILKYL